MAITDIEWSDYVWNPVRGCSMAKGSELGGCLYCYAARQAARNLPGMRSPTTGEPFAILTDNGPRWTGKVELIESKLTEPLHWKKPRRVFVNSMSDLFHGNLPDEAIDRIFAVMALTPHITYQVLTKRVERMREYVAEGVPRATVGYRVDTIACNLAYEHHIQDRDSIAATKTWPLPNVHLGVSVENQACKYRIEDLRRTPAAMRFLSLEPLLQDLAALNLEGIGWVIVGGESGFNARPMHPKWVRSIRNQCVAAGVPFFFKQWGEHEPISTIEGIQELPFGDYNVPLGWGFNKRGKKAAGALLDGREWRQMPKVHQGVSC